MSVEIYSSGSLVSSGMIIENANIQSGRNDSMHISYGGTATNTTVNSSGRMHIRSGGTANSTTLNSGGYMYISSGGVANSTMVNSSGWMYIYSGGVVNSTTVNDGGYMYISSGGVANSTTVNSGGYMRIYSGGTATDITALDGVRLGITVASNTYIQGTYNGSAFEMKDAYISGYTVNSGGCMRISSGGVANSTTVNSGGSMYIYSGGTANSTTVNDGGWMYISSGGVANSTTVNSGGWMYISSGGVANDTTVNDLGDMYIYSGGTANSTTVNSRGRVYISSGGTANSTMVNSGGWMYISSGGKHTGSLQMANGAIVSAYEGSIIDFTVADRTASDGYLINDLSLISGTPTYTITVSAEQSDGTYKLAQGASLFTGSITIGDGTINYGSITVNGDVFKYNGVDYQLTQQNGNLQLSIRDLIPPAAPTYTVSNTALTNQNVTVSATFSSDSVVKEFSLNGKDWQTYTDGIVFTANGEVFFRSCDIAGNYSAVVTAVVKEIDDVADKNDTAYIFIKSSFTEKNTKNKKQNGIPLVFGENAFNTLTDFEHSAAYKVVMLDSKVNIYSETDLTEIGTVSSIVIQPKIKNNETLHSYSASSTPKGTLNINGKDTQNVLFKDFTTVNLSNSANVNSIEGGKLTVSETEKSSVKKDVVTENYSYSKTVAASGKVNISNASAANISGYATVTLDNGTAETLSNADTKISYQKKYVDGIADTITETETYSAKGTATLKNSSEVDNISGFKTVKLTDSFAANIELGDSYTEKFTLKKGVENTVVKETFTGTVTLENSKIGSVCGMNKVTASKGFNFIESYEGSNGNDTLTISKNAVLSLGSINFKDGKKDKLVNNGTLILTAEINRGYISGKGEIAACDEVLQSMKYTYGILNLGATADGFRTTKYELADSSAKKAVKWDLKSDYTGWLSGDSDCIDTVDFVKFKTGKESSMIEISGFSDSDTISLVDKKGNAAELTFADGVFKAELAAKTDYILELGIDKGDESMSYTLAVG